MLIEFAGCSGAGKTTLANTVLVALQERGYRAAYSRDLVAKLTSTAWISNLTLRHAAQNIVLLPRSLWSIRKYYRFYKLAVPTILRDSAGLMGRFNRLRSLMRQVASDDLLKGSRNRFELTLADENTLGCAHNVFGHVDSPPDLEAVRRYAELVSAPDLFIHIDVPLEVAVLRTLKRPDLPSRLRPDGRRRDTCERFLSHGLAIYRELATAEEFEGRVKTVVNSGDDLESLDSLVEQIIEFILEASLPLQDRKRNA